MTLLLRDGRDAAAGDETSVTRARTRTAPTEPRPGHQRLRVVAIGAGLYALSGPGQTAGFSVFVNPVTETLDISRGQLTAAYLAATLLAAPSGIWLGRQLDHRNIGTVVRFVAAGLGLALAVVAASPALWLLTIGIFGLRLFGQTGFTLTSSVFVARSITERRGAALGMLTAVGGAAITLTPLASSRLIPYLGWRQTWMCLALVIVLCGFALARSASRSSSWITRTTTSADPGLVARPTAEAVECEFTNPAVRRRRRFAFAVVATGFAATAAVTTALGFHQIAILEERGLTAGAAAANFLPQSIAAAMTALAVSRVIDRINGRIVIPASMTLLVAALLAVRAVHSTPTALLYGVILGSAAASMSATDGTLLTRWLGTDGLGTTRGRLMAIIVTASATAPLAFNFLADATGSYTNAATAAIAVPIAVAVLAAVAPLPAAPSSALRLAQRPPTAVDTPQ